MQSAAKVVQNYLSDYQINANRDGLRSATLQLPYTDDVVLNLFLV